MKTIDKDKDAKFIYNRSQHRMPHGLRPGVNFEPGEVTRVKLDDWIKAQAVLTEVADPDAELPAQLKPETPLNGGMPGVKSTGPVTRDADRK